MPKEMHILPWLLDYRTDDDLVPLHIEITNWVREPREPWSACLAVRYAGYPKVSAELIIRIVGGGYLADVWGSDIAEPMREVLFETFHAAQLAAEQHALHVCHLIPIDA